MKVVQYLVKEVNQFPSDVECMRYIATIADKVGGVFFLSGTLVLSVRIYLSTLFVIAEL